MLTATLMVCALTAAGADNPQAANDELALYPIEDGIIQRTNEERVRHGLTPLKVDSKLIRTARKHTIWMVNNRSMTHGHDAVAENIAMGQRDSSEAVQTWMNSSGHRANILNRVHRRIGVAAFRTPEGTIYWCQQFGD